MPESHAEEAARSEKVAVIGLGYVGLPLSIQVASKGFSVYGIDSSVERIEKINNLDLNHEDVDLTQISRLKINGKLNISGDFSLTAEVGTVLICVPTPLNLKNEPDLSSLLQVIKDISPHLKPGTLISLESTSYPGTTEELLKPTLLKTTRLSDDELFFAFSPERVDPRNRLWNLENTPKVVSGVSELDSKKAFHFYSKVFSSVVLSSSTKAAEMAKLLENSFRLVNISLINELAHICQVIGIDVNEVIRLAATKPFGFLPFFPGPGIGGHCIPVDPVYMIHKANEFGATSKLIEEALSQNSYMPELILRRCKEVIGAKLNPRIGVVGLAYKPNISDTRESPSVKFIELARAQGADVFWNDEIVGVWAGEHSMSLQRLYETVDIVVLMVRHDYLTYFPTAHHIKILDCTYSLDIGPGIQRL